MVTGNGSLPGAPVKLPISQARRLALHSLGLLRRDPFGRGWRGAWRAIEHLGFIEASTLSRWWSGRIIISCGRAFPITEPPISNG